MVEPGGWVLKATRCCSVGPSHSTIVPAGWLRNPMKNFRFTASPSGNVKVSVSVLIEKVIVYS